MSSMENLIEKLKSRPKTFPFNKMCTVLTHLGFKMSNKGRTSGSRVMFIKGSIRIMFDRPHPGNEMLSCYIERIVDKLEEEGLL